jgi:hypothetical protein
VVRKAFDEGGRYARHVRRYVFRDEVLDGEAAGKLGTRVHQVWYRAVGEDYNLSALLVTHAVAYYQDLHAARGLDVPRVYPEDVCEVIGYNSVQAGQYARDAVRAGLLVGNGTAGWSIPPDWLT